MADDQADGALATAQKLAAAKVSDTKGWERVVIAEGDGKHFPKKGDELTMRYTGKLESNATVPLNAHGQIFDSTENPKGTTKGRPFRYPFNLRILR